MKIVAVTACPTGIAHTYMAADALTKAAPKYNVQIKVETQGAMGIENPLTPYDLSHADKVLIVSDIDIEQPARFEGMKVVKLDRRSATQCRQSLSRPLPLILA